jgi:valyl-tRNA synthetase
MAIEHSAGTSAARDFPAELPKTYDPGAVEQKWYRFWEEGGYFKPRMVAGRRPFVISMPPPNVTGALHLGHAITATIEDIMIRYHRMAGDPTLWVPGEDHAGIATQTVVERLLAAEGTDRHQLGRERFLERVWQWVQTYKHRIQDQHRRLGASCDWSRERFTMDEGLSKAVREVFVRLYEEGLIYRGERIINWCPRCMSAISDLEVEHEDTPGKLWYVRYPLKPVEPPLGQQGDEASITVATTRPETILGDTAVAVNPRDERYAGLVGRTAILPALGREIPIIADKAVDPAFGTGAVKVTPAHDPTDFEIGNRHDLPRVQVIGFDARMTAEAGPYAGQDRYEARQNLLADLERAGLLVKAEDYTIPLGHCSRCDTVIEPLISKQWFIKMLPLATPALGAVRYGQVRIVPERFTKIYTDWLENIHDWNISRQLWWGHRIPAWYCADCAEMVVAREDPASCPRCGSARLEQDPDVLDTWFSSWLWPFSTLGWPEDTADLRTFYPTSVMETGYDIIFFWVARMIMAGIHFLGTPPFHTVYLHGLIRDQYGEKMSKSKGNVVDPLEVMDEYGTDALRFTLATSSTPGNDMKLVPDRIVGNRNFANKIWNAARFVLLQTQAKWGEDPGNEGSASDPGPEGPGPGMDVAFQLGDPGDEWPEIANGVEESRRILALKDQGRDAGGRSLLLQGEAVFDLEALYRRDGGSWTLADRWIVSRAQRLTREVTRLIEEYQFGEAGRQIFEFFWSEYCDWYLEIAKVQIQGEQDDPGPRGPGQGDRRRATADLLRALLDRSMRLLHPFMPFVTEEVWQHLYAGVRARPAEALIVAPWPEASSAQEDAAAEADFALLQTIITRIRDARAQMRVEPGRRIPVILATGEQAGLLERQGPLIAALARTQPPRVEREMVTKPEQAMSLLAGTIAIYLPLAGMIDLTKEIARLDREIGAAEQEIERGERMLANASFTSRAKPEVVQKEREKLEANRERLARLREQRGELGDGR